VEGSIYIVSDHRGSYHYVVDKLVAEAGAELIALHPNRRDRTISKVAILGQMLTPRLLRLRKRWTRDDVVLVISWYLIPVLLLLRLRALHRPRRLVSMATFVQNARLRRAVNVVLGALRIDELELIVFSEAERRNLVEVVGVPPPQVHRVVYRGKMHESAEDYDGGYVFTGGYTNRDYETFFAAVRDLSHDVIAVASAHNQLSGPPPNVDLRIDVPWDEFERLIARCALLVLPLRAGGEACGQNVLFRGLRHHRPVVATRHEALIDYLGDDYPGFVPTHDPVALRTAIEHGLSDQTFRRLLLERVTTRARAFRQQEDFETEILRILLRPGGTHGPPLRTPVATPN
jgi:glycosyltransferase involved in cell wall biosynthesis